MSTSLLFTPLEIRSVQLKNRICVSPMCMYSSRDGYSNNWHLVHLGSRAVGGAGLVIFEATAVSPEGRITADDLGIWQEDHISGLAEIVTFLEEQGSTAGIQLAHAGRKASTTPPWLEGRPVSSENGGWRPVAPSPVPFFQGADSPEELDQKGIEKVITDFKEAAKRALRAGFKVLEIHAAHGYLLHQFLSPLTNSRKDAYGGSYENRTRLLLEVVEEVRTIWPVDLPLFVRISATDWVEGGWDQMDSVELAKLLKERGVDLIDCSSGGIVPDASIPVNKGYQVPFAKAVKQEAEILTGAVGLITKASEAEEILQRGDADLVLLARELLRNPYFPLQAAHELGEEYAWPPQYRRAQFRS